MKRENRGEGEGGGFKKEKGALRSQDEGALCGATEWSLRTLTGQL